MEVVSGRFFGEWPAGKRTVTITSSYDFPDSIKSALTREGPVPEDLKKAPYSLTAKTEIGARRDSLGAGGTQVQAKPKPKPRPRPKPKPGY